MDGLISYPLDLKHLIKTAFTRKCQAKDIK